MKLSDLRTGMFVITRNHDIYLVLRDFLSYGSTGNLFWKYGDWLYFDRYNDDLTCRVDYDDFIDPLTKGSELSPTEKRNARRRARYYAKSHDIMEVRMPRNRELLFKCGSPGAKTIWKRDQNIEVLLGSNDEGSESDVRGYSSFHFPETLHHQAASLSDLKTGLIVTLRNGDNYLVFRDFYDSNFHNDDILWSESGSISLSQYSKNMNYIGACISGTESSTDDSPYDIYEVYQSEIISDFYHKRTVGGNILWRNEPLSVTYRRWILDVPPCCYTGNTHPLFPEGTVQTWVSEEMYESFLKNEGVRS